MRASSQKLNQNLHNQIAQVFNQTVADIKNADEANTFLKDFLTDTEYDAFAKRLAIAYWLKKGRSYNNIRNNLKVSSATIATVQSLMDNKGFQLALQKIEAEEWANQWADRIKKFVGK